MSSSQGAPALLSWFSQVSQAISSVFNGPGPTSGSLTEPSHVSPVGSEQDLADSTHLDRGSVGGLDLASMNAQERLEAIHSRLAYLGLTNEQIAERLSTIPEEKEDLESQLFSLEEGRRSPLPSHYSVDTRMSYQEVREHKDLDQVSLGSQDITDWPGPELCNASIATEGSLAQSLSRQVMEGSLEEETAMDNQGNYDNNDATDSSSTWTPEEQTGEEGLSKTLAPNAHQPILTCGDLVIILDYKASLRRLLVTVVMARDIPDKERSGVDSWQVHVVLLPAKRQRHKTGVQRGSTPHFGETFQFSQLEAADLKSSALRFRLYAVSKMVRERMMGETVFHLRGLSLEGEMEATLVLEPRTDMKSADSQSSLCDVSQSESASSTQSLSHGGVPELLIGLAYNATTGRLSVELIKGSHFRNLAVNRPPDTYGKLALLDSVGQEISRCKTTIRRGQPHPVYKETFVFQVALFQLSTVTLMVSIYNRRSMNRKEMVGWVSLGHSASGQEEQLHWQDMCESQGQQVCRWHVLLES